MKINPVILAVDTATYNISVALVSVSADNPNILASVDLNNKITHSQQLVDCVSWVLKKSNISCKDLDAFAIGLGPGSFTGLRIGMSSIKGLAAASNKPLVGVSTLDSIAFNCSTDRIICVITDARKKEVYSSCYRLKSNGELKCISDIIAIGPAGLLAYLKKIKEPILLVGDGVQAYNEFFKDLKADIMVAPSTLHFPNAKSLAILAGQKLLKGDLLDLQKAVPLYIRKSDAELSMKNV